MIDTIYLNKSGYPGELLYDNPKENWEIGFDKKRSKYFYKNITVGKYKVPIMFKYSPKIRSLKLEFSLHKYLLGDNYINYNLLCNSIDVLPTLNNDLQQYLRVSIDDFNINRFDVGINIKTDCEGENYVKTLDTLLPKKIWKKIKSWFSNETLLVRDNTTSILFYDKVRELHSRGIYPNSITNLLRIENQIKNTQGLLAQHRFNGRLTFEEIFIPVNYYKLLDLLYNNFNELLPFNKDIVTTDTETILEYIKNKFSKNYMIDVYRLFKEFRNQTTSMSIIENKLNQKLQYRDAIKKKILQELRVLLISNSNLGYRKLVEEIYTKILKEKYEQEKGGMD